MAWQTLKENALDIGALSFVGEGTAEDVAEAIREDGPVEDQTRAELLQHEIIRIGYRMGILSHGEDFLIDNGAPPELLETFLSSRAEAIAKAAAQRLNIDDYRLLMMKSTRTKEQERVMGEIAGREAVTRLRVYLLSNYHAAIEYLMADFAAALKTDVRTLSAGDDWEDLSASIAFLTRYFFALHGEARASGVEYIDPAAEAALDGDQQEELSRIAEALVAFRRRHGGGYYQNIAPCFGLEEIPSALIPQTETARAESIGLPTSYLWQRQHEVARAGILGATLDVGRRRTSSPPVIVSAKISDKEGKPLEIDGIRRGAQMAIGNLIDDNGGKLPIVITPEQVYRRWAGLDIAVRITEQQAAEMEAAIDSLLSSPSQIDFSAQLQQQKRIRRQPDYDYEAEGAGGMLGNLIAGEKRWITRANGSRAMGYIIYDYPMLYRYSHIVGQITTVKRSLITGGEKAAIKEDKRAGAQYSSRDVSMRHNVLTRIERMKKSGDLRPLLIMEVARDIGEPMAEGSKTERTLLKNLEIYLRELKEQGEISGYSRKMGGRGNRKHIGFTVTFSAGE